MQSDLSLQKYNDSNYQKAFSLLHGNAIPIPIRNYLNQKLVTEELFGVP